MSDQEKLDPVKDPEGGLEVRYTDNSPKPDDPPQIAPFSNEPLELDADGVPFILKAVK